MVLWIAMAVLTAAASIALLAPLFRARVSARTSDEAVAIYRDQLDEVNRDVARGVLADSEAVAARNEISRRMLRADSVGTATVSKPLLRHRITAALAVVGVPVVAVGVYLWLGSPQLPDRPLASRLGVPDTQDLPALVAILDQTLAERPDDADGWRMAIPLYVAVGRYDTAVDAYANLVRIGGVAADPQGIAGMGLGETIARAEGGITPPASRAFAMAREINPGSIELRIYHAAELTDAGKRDEAIAVWRGVVADAPADAPWLVQVREQLTQLEALAPGGATPAPGAAAPVPDIAPAPAAVAAAVPPGPTPEDVAAAQALPPEQQMAMIAGMVGRLADRLAENPDDAPGWAMLVTSYAQLGRTEDARKALADARVAFVGRTEALTPVEDAARRFNLE